MKKAQLAVETLLIYGIAILIVMLAIGALVSFGVLDLGGLLPDQCQISGELSCENFLVRENEVQIELLNNFQRNIESMNVTIIGEGNNEGLWNCEWGGHGLLTQGDVSAPIRIPCQVAVPAGKKINGQIRVNVTLVNSDIDRPLTGRIRAPVT